MKNSIKAYISAVALAAASMSVLLVTESATGDAPRAFGTVINPDIPQKMTLCGKTVDLDRTDMWERLDRELTSMAYTHGNTMLIIKRANKLFPRMAPILKKHGVPEDLLYLACIESNLDQRAYSSAKAAGIWQFIPSTATQFGLEVSDEIDERYNIEKETEAACKFLKSSYAKYGNWESAMAAFNGGTGRISKELAAQGVDTSFDLYLVSETSRYVFRILAMKAIMEDPKAFGFNLKADQLYQPVKFREVNVSGPVADWPTWASGQGITYAQLVEANPWIRGKKLTNKTGKTYTVKIPTKESLSRSKQAKSLYNQKWVQ
ncbi:MAG: lytic transglycosylase domain-containing protein [Muribaculaceae bacterium]|nr:lytic transglycosylase domain-containing protein [Muribaculaceae bacterium]